MKIRQTIFLLPLFLLAGCASAGGSQSRDLDLKELCTEEQVFQYADFEWGTDSEQLFKQSFLKFDEKDLGQGDESSTKTYESKEKFSLENAESNMDLEFSDGQLSQVSFTFDIEQDANTWIQKEVDELNSLYGGGIATGLGNQIYQWQGEQDTVLQLTAFTEGDGKRNRYLKRGIDGILDWIIKLTDTGASDGNVWCACFFVKKLSKALKARKIE